MGLKLFDRFGIEEVPRQHCNQGICEISKQYDNSSHSFWLRDSTISYDKVSYFE